MFDLKQPCDSCPFLIKGGVRLRRERAREIAKYFLDPQGGTFPCHKTVDYDDDDEGAERPMRRGEQMCVGGILFADKLGRRNQMVRIATRTGYNMRALKGRPLVFGSLLALLETAIDKQLDRRRRTV